MISAGAGITPVGTDFLAGSAAFIALVAIAAAHNGITGFARQLVVIAGCCCGRAGMATVFGCTACATCIAPPITANTFARTRPASVAVLRAVSRVFVALALSFGSVRAVHLFTLAVFQRIARFASRAGILTRAFRTVFGTIVAHAASAGTRCRQVLSVGTFRIGGQRRSANRASFTGAFGTRTVRHSARDAVVAVDGCCRFIPVVACTLVASAVRSRSSFGFGVALLARSYESLFSTGFLLCRAAPASSAAVASAVVNRCLTAAGAITEGVRSTAVAVAFGTQFRTIVITRP